MKLIKKLVYKHINCEKLFVELQPRTPYSNLGKGSPPKIPLHPFRESHFAPPFNIAEYPMIHRRWWDVVGSSLYMEI